MLSDEGRRELEELFTLLISMVDDSLQSFQNGDVELAKKVVRNEDLVDELEELFRYRYIERLKNGEITFVVAENYADILSNLERIGDHLTNIAGAVIEPLYVPQSLIVPKPHEIDKDI
jgi:phosphate:Na+ symporter